MMGMLKNTALIALAAALLASALVAAEEKPSARPVAFQIEAQPMKSALDDFARQTGLQIIFPSDEVARGLSAPPVIGTFSPEVALQRLLSNSGLQYQFINADTVAIRSKAEGKALTSIASGATNLHLSQGAMHESETSADLVDAAERPNRPKLEEVVVTGTNIKGVAPAGSPVIVMDHESIRRSGYTSTEQLIQSLPQNIRSGAEGASADARYSLGATAGRNVTRGSGANLRGLGSTATLTLINGRRIVNSSFGSFADLSMIPIGAIERIEVLTDGASAIYGADAVAGVVNVILKQDYDGAETRLRYGRTAPEGRDEERASQTLGAKWANGSGLAVLDYLKQSRLDAGDRDFTAERPLPADIFPSNRQFGIVLSGRQHFRDRLTAQADAQYATVRRYSEALDTTFPPGTYHFPTTVKRLNAGLTLSYALTDTWSLALDGLASRERNHYNQLLFPLGADEYDPASSERQRLLQKEWSGGLSLTGSLVELPGGKLGVALGAVHRDEDYLRTNADTDYREPAQRKIDSAFAELHVPFFSEANARTGLQRLESSFAVRYDHYSDFGGTVNPKIGLSWEPIHGLEFHSSYSTSFRAPSTGYELNSSLLGTNIYVLLVSFAAADGSGNVPVAYIQGSQPLKAEKADTFTVGFNFRPQSQPGLQFGLTYYDIKYRDRIVTPPFDQGALSIPGLQSFISTHGSPAELQSLLAGLTQNQAIYLDITGPDFAGGEFGPNPENITTLLFDDRSTNAGRVSTSGLDFTVDYTRDLGGGVLNLALNANRINQIDTVFAPGASTFDFVGTTGNPTHLRTRTSAAYQKGAWDGALSVNYNDKYTDTSGVVDSSVNAYITVDANLRYEFAHETYATLSGTNLFNEQPPYIEAAGRGSHYDSANADPLGRLIALELTKRW